MCIWLLSRQPGLAPGYLVAARVQTGIFNNLTNYKIFFSIICFTAVFKYWISDLSSLISAIILFWNLQQQTASWALNSFPVWWILTNSFSVETIESAPTCLTESTGRSGDSKVVIMFSKEILSWAFNYIISSIRLK